MDYGLTYIDLGLKIMDYVLTGMDYCHTVTYYLGKIGGK